MEEKMVNRESGRNTTGRKELPSYGNEKENATRENENYGMEKGNATEASGTY